MTVHALTPRGNETAARPYRERKPSQYDGCPKCGQPKRTKSRLCLDCRKVEPRPRPSTDKHAGHVWAQKNIPLATSCERCGAPARDRHHRDGNPLNNVPENIAHLCRRCHMEADGRLRWRLNKRDSHCKRGHALSGDNVYTHLKTGSRRCRTCHAERDRTYRQRRRAGA